MTLQNKSSATHSKMDEVFSIVLIVFCIGCMVQLFISIYREALGSGLFSTAGVTGSAILYMKWSVLRKVKNIKDATVSEISDLLKNDSKSTKNEQ